MENRKKTMDQFFNKLSETNLKKYIELVTARDEKSTLNYVPFEEMRYILICITTTCNLDCVWCHRHEPDFRQSKYLQTEMSLERLGKLLPKFERFEKVLLGGLGEPIMHSNIIECIKLSKKYIKNVQLTTNATLLSKKRCQQLAESGLTHLEVSIDGFDDKTNQMFRGPKENKLIENVKYLDEISDIEIQINTVISSENYEGLFDAIDKLHVIKGLKKLHLIPLFMTSHMRKMGFKDVTQMQFNDLVEHYKERINSLDTNIKLWPDNFDMELDPQISMKRNHNICYQLYENPCINVYGYLSPCAFLENVSIVDAVETDFEEIWNGEDMLTWRKEQIEGNYCSQCQNYCHMKNYGNDKYENLPGYKGRGKDPEEREEYEPTSVLEDTEWSNTAKKL